MGYKKISVLFLGGLDSTYLIWKNLKEKNEVFPFYNDGEIIDVERKKERS